MTWEILLKENMEERKKKLLSDIEKLMNQIKTEKGITEKMRNRIKGLEMYVEHLAEMLE
jgi:hypothetical protein